MNTWWGLLAARSLDDGEVGIRGDKLRCQLDQRHLRRVDLQVSQKDSAEPFVDEDAAVLRVVRKFHYVEAAVIPFNEMRLGSAAHFTNQAAGDNRHESEAGRGCTDILVLAKNQNTLHPGAFR